MRINIFIILFCAALTAQQAKISFDHIGIEDGLSQGTVFTVLQDNLGFMWFGTEDGLNRFDGYDFKVYKNKPSDSLSLHNNFVTALHQSRDGKIWIGTLKGLSLYDPLSETFSQSGIWADSINYYITDMCEDSLGQLWIATRSAGVFQLDPAGKTLLRHSKSTGLADNKTWRLKTTQRGVWVATSNGLSLYSNEKARPLNFIPPRHIDAAVSDFLVNPDGTLWVAFEHAGLARLDPASGQFILKRQLEGKDLLHLERDTKNRIWIATRFAGVNVYDPKTAAIVSLRHNKENRHSLSGNFVEVIYKDRNNLMWVGCNANGINMYDPLKRKFGLLEESDGLSDKMIYEIYEDPLYNGEVVWIGTDKGGLNRFNKTTGSINVFRFEKNNPFSLQNNSVRAVFRDKKNRLWVGTANGLFHFKEEQNRFIWFKKNNPEIAQLSIRELTQNPASDDDVLWIADARDGMIRYDIENDTISYFNTKGLAGFSSDLIRSATFTSDGLLWLGTLGGGLMKLDPRTHMVQSYLHDEENGNSIGNNIVLSIKEIKNRHNESFLWIGTAQGISKLNRQTKIFTNFDEGDGLPNEVAYCALPDKNGHVWVATNEGLAQFNPQDSTFKNYDVNDGLQGMEFNLGAYEAGAGGILYFGGTNGLNYFHPDSLVANKAEPAVYITNFKKFNRDVNLDSSILFQNKLKLSYSDDFFSFEFAAIDYSAPEKNEHAYKLDGFDEDWIYCGSRRYAGYTNLDPGTYRFRVKGSNNDGVWNEQGASLLLVISSPPWKSWWAYILYAAALYLLFWAGRWIIQNRKSILALRKRKISHFKLLNVIGEGGLGVVHKAVDVNDNRQLAIKLLKPDLLEDDKNRQRFANEGRMLTTLNHPRIVKTYEIGETGKQGYIAMEFLRGGTLQEYIRKNKPLGPAEIQRIASQVLQALQAIHDKGIIHRDLKSGNIMLDDHNNIRVMDFGLSKSPIVATMTTLGTVMGTLGYVAPEQITNVDVDHRVDIFSFGVVLYEMLTARIPFEGENEMALIHAIFNSEPQKPSVMRDDIVPDWDDVVSKCLDKEPANRFQSAQDVAEALTDLNLIQMRL